MVQQELKELGFTDNEIKIYLALLRYGTLNPTALAEKTGLHRSYIYDTTERLLEREMISTVRFEGKKHFCARDPKSLRETIEFKLRTANTIIPQLSGLYKLGREETAVEMHKGTRAFRTQIKSITARMHEHDIVRLFGVDEDLLNTIEPIYLKQYFTILKNKHAEERIIIPTGAKHIRGSGLHYRELPKEHFGNTLTIIHRSIVYLFVKGMPHRLIMIEDEEIAASYAKQFDLLWKVAIEARKK